MFASKGAAVESANETGASFDGPGAGRTVAGWLALGLTVLLWASFALTARGIGRSSLTVADAAFLRFATPVVVLSPLLPATLRAVRRERRSVLALLLVGGLPHYLVFAFGADLTSAALTGMLVPGTVPLFVTILAVVGGTSPARIPGRRLLALVLITSGVALSGILVGGGASLGGVGLLLTGGFAWAIFTVGLQRTELTMVQMVTTVCATSSVACAALALSGVMPSRLLAGSAQAGDVVMILVLQGLGTGLLSTLCYAFAVRSLGSGLAAAGGAVSPVLTAVLAIPLFGERISLGLAAALTLIVVGVAVFNATGARVARRRNPTSTAGVAVSDTGPGLAFVQPSEDAAPVEAVGLA